EALTRIGGFRNDGAGPYKALGFAGLFVNRVSFNGSGYLRHVFRNDTNALRQYLAGRNGKPGDCFCIRIPAGPLWDTYAGNPEVYTGNPLQEIITGYPALCVVGYNDQQNFGKGAFKAIACKGAQWGLQGYVWLSYDFVRQFAIEAWRLTDSIGFVAKEVTPERPWAPKGRDGKQWQNADYTFLYVGPGIPQVTTAGITIAGSGLQDTLTIQKNRAAEYIEDVPLIEFQTASLTPIKKIYINGVTVGMLNVTTCGLDTLTCVNSHVRQIEAWALNKVQMSNAINSTWRLFGAGISSADPGEVNKSIATTSISLVAASSTWSPTIKLSGVGMKNIYMNDFNGAVSLSMNSKIVSRSMRGRAVIPAYASYGGLSGDLRVGSIRKLDITGGGIKSNIQGMAQQSGASIQALTKSMPLTSAYTYVDGTVFRNSLTLNADITATIYTSNTIGSIAASGGNISLYSLAAGSIGSVRALHRNGHGGTLSGVLVSGLSGVGSMNGLSSAASAAALSIGPQDIGEVYGDIAVNVTLAAGAAPYLNSPIPMVAPSCAGALHTVGSSEPYLEAPYGGIPLPSIAGIGWWNTLAAAPKIVWPQTSFVQGVCEQKYVIDVTNGEYGQTPPNDAFAAAINVTGLAIVNGATRFATMEAGEPAANLSSTLQTASVWYKWTAPTSSSINFEIIKPFTFYPRTLAAYAGDALANLTLKVSTTATTLNKATKITFAPTAGQTYYIAVCALTTRQGDFQMTIY
ncbi:MAG: hypothetical protein NTX50_12725, partial [Candidatus Sumerlaeota bacterium]|nr:hypothetical protein [Candidatus Sumerlaeota bacterium]